MGVKGQIELRVSEFPRLVGTAEGYYYRGVTTDSENAGRWSGGVAYQLDEKGHFTVEAEYERGDAPLTLDTVETVVVGIGIKF